VFLIWFGGTYVVNGMLIDWSSIAQTFRPWNEELRLFPVLIGADLLLSASIVWFYAHLKEPKPWPAQGLIYGLRVSLFVIVPMYARNFVAAPETVKMLVQQLVFLTLLMMLIGAVVGFLYRDAPVT
jgi:hypothetical protein